MVSTLPREERLAVRLTATQKRVVEQAAAVQGRSVSDFSVQALTERAEEVLTDRRLFTATDRQWASFTAALDAPAQPNPGLARLAAQPALQP